MINWHVSLGCHDPHYRELQRCSRTQRATAWTINSRARPGDCVAFYLMRPDSALVAVGTVLAHPLKQPRGPWRGHFMTRIGGIKMLRRPVALGLLRDRYPDWGWARTPRGTTVVPVGIAPSFSKLLCAAPSPTALITDAAEREGAPIEYRVTRRGRSRQLRDQAFSHANGVCETCGRNFGRILEGRGTRVLQVHHRKQMAEWSAPRVTRLSDLAVVCANCHQLLHIDRDRALRIDELRRLLHADRIGKGRRASG